MKKQSNPPPPLSRADRPNPPPGPPCRHMRDGLFRTRETKESIRAREDYETYMRGYTDGRGAMNKKRGCIN